MGWDLNPHSIRCANGFYKGAFSMDYIVTHKSSPLGWDNAWLLLLWLSWVFLACVYICLDMPHTFFFGWISILVLIYNILSLSSGGRPFHPFVPSSVLSSIHPSSSSEKKKMMEEEEGGGRMAAAVYPNVYVIQSCSLWKIPVVLQFAKSYKLILKN